MSSSVTGVFSGAPRSFQSGNSSFECGRLEDGAGQNVRTDFGTFFDHADADVIAGFDAQLPQSAGGRQAGRARADDHDIKLHGFAFHYDLL